MLLIFRNVLYHSQPYFHFFFLFDSNAFLELFLEAFLCFFYNIYLTHCLPFLYTWEKNEYICKYQIRFLLELSVQSRWFIHQSILCQKSLHQNHLKKSLIHLWYVCVSFFSWQCTRILLKKLADSFFTYFKCYFKKSINITDKQLQWESSFAI